jgi:segregation and condensation protein B
MTEPSDATPLADDTSEVATGAAPALDTEPDDGDTITPEASEDLVEPDPEDDPEAPDAGRPAVSPELLPATLEALLFVSDGPVEARTLARALGVTSRAVGTALDALQRELAGRGVRLQLGPDGAQLVTAPEAAAFVEAFLGLEQGRRLSNAALEALAIIAYRQPVTRATVDAIRGVSSDGAMQTLRARGLIEEAGRAQGPGRPTLFVTAQRFLEHFGLESPAALPDVGDYDLPPPDAPMPLPGFGAEALRREPSNDEASTEAAVAADLAALSASARRFGLGGPPAAASHRDGPAATEPTLPAVATRPPFGHVSVPDIGGAALP